MLHWVQGLTPLQVGLWTKTTAVDRSLINLNVPITIFLLCVLIILVNVGAGSSAGSSSTINGQEAAEQAAKAAASHAITASVNRRQKIYGNFSIAILH